jgi:hypothetical protein
LRQAINPASLQEGLLMKHGIGLVGLVLGLSSLAPAESPTARAEFSQLHTLIKPAAGEEKWREVPWMVSLWEARLKAAAEGKPILLWEMDGHPLGCT